MPAKASLYALDPYFWEGWEDVSEHVGPQATALASRHTLILLRPDAIANRKAGAVLDWLAANEFILVECFALHVDRHQVRALWQYQWNTAIRERKDACDALMCGGPSLLLIVRDEAEPNVGGSAANRFASLKGSADPARRRPGDLRAQLAHKSRMLSLLHSPDEPADFVRELAILLDESARQRLLTAMRGNECKSLEQANAVAKALYRELPEHSLELCDALSHVESAVRGSLRPDDPDLGELLSLIERARCGARLDWRELFALLDRRDIAYRPWDRVVIAGHVIAMDAPGVQTLIGHPPGRAVL